MIIANDPDADRLGAAEKDESSPTGWKIFSGNEIGVMLGHFHLMKQKSKGSSRQLAVLASVVSSRMLQAIARAEGVRYADTLTGFKWLGTEALRLEHEEDCNVSSLCQGKYIYTSYDIINGLMASFGCNFRSYSVMKRLWVIA